MAGAAVEPLGARSGTKIAMADGTLVHLAGLVGAEADRSEPAQRYLAEAQRQIDVWLRHDHWTVNRRGTDRYGEVWAVLVSGSGLSLQTHLVDAGLGRVDGFMLADDDVAALLQREDRARSARLGLWQSISLRPQPAHRLHRTPHAFTIIEGRVREVTDTRDFTYLNFTDDWRSDTSVRVPAGDRKAFRAAGLDLASLAGVTIRTRGYAFAANGPMIQLDRPVLLERLET
ncbi:MAG: thermonuclease family protein [Geminicoccaceae bacterium]